MRIILLAIACSVLCCGRVHGVEPAVLTNDSAPLWLLPVPWTNNEQLRFDIKQADGAKSGVLIYTAQTGAINGREYWQFASRMFAGIQQFSRVEADPVSFAPFRSRWKHSLFGDADAAYSTNQVYVAVKGKEPQKFNPQGAVYDSEEIPHLLRRLPLQTNYTQTVNVLSTLPKSVLYPLKIVVAAIEKVWVPAGEFVCFKVELSTHQTFWISTATNRYVVRFRTSTAEADLSEVGQVKTSEPTVCWNKESGMYITAPPGWAFFEADASGLMGKIYLLDPEATATTCLKVWNRDALPEKAKTSLRAWTDYELKEASPDHQDFILKNDKWLDQPVAGALGLSVTCDFSDSPKTYAYESVGFIGSKAVALGSQMPAEQSASIIPALRAILNSLKSY
jgi:hypothetical protein